MTAEEEEGEEEEEEESQNSDPPRKKSKSDELKAFLTSKTRSSTNGSFRSSAEVLNEIKRVLLLRRYGQVATLSAKNLCCIENHSSYKRRS